MYPAHVKDKDLISIPVDSFFSWPEVHKETENWATIINQILRTETQYPKRVSLTTGQNFLTGIYVHG